jgi:hypothetical protein
MSTPKKMIATDKQNGKSMTKSQKKLNPSKGVASLVSESSPSSSIASNVSPQLSMDFFFGVISIVDVRCLQDVISFIINVKNHE